MKRRGAGIKRGFLLLCTLLLFPGLTEARQPAFPADYEVQGFDLVAYFKDNEARRGTSRFKAQHKGRLYAFTSASHRREFLAEPEKYLPAFAAHCAYGMSNGMQSMSDPMVFSIVEDQLFLHTNAVNRELWSRNAAEHIRRGSQAWSVLRLADEQSHRP